MRHAVAGVALVAAVAIFGLAQAGRAGAPPLSEAGRKFLKAADEIDMAEAKLGKLVQENATATAIKEFGARMQADHSKMNRELRAVAKQHGFELPTKLDAAHLQLYSQLSKLKGANFDQVYARDMVSGHEKAIQTFETAVSTVKDRDVKAWAEKWLPTLREHLQLARKAVNKVKGER
jgi:putative membrane protein